MNFSRKKKEIKIKRFGVTHLLGLSVGHFSGFEFGVILHYCDTGAAGQPDSRVDLGPLRTLPLVEQHKGGPITHFQIFSLNILRLTENKAQPMRKVVDVLELFLGITRQFWHRIPKFGTRKKTIYKNPIFFCV